MQKTQHLQLPVNAEPAAIFEPVILQSPTQPHPSRFPILNVTANPVLADGGEHSAAAVSCRITGNFRPCRSEDENPPVSAGSSAQIFRQAR
jgi:hypothetical protein